MIVLGIGRTIGSTGYSELRRPLPDGGPTIPVLAVSRRASGLPARAVVALDFTPATLAAASLAADLLADDGPRVVVHVCAFAGAKANVGDW